MRDIRPFRIQAEQDIPPCTIPWWLAEEAYVEYASHYGTEQTLERLNERGGFGGIELLKLLRQER